MTLLLKNFQQYNTRGFQMQLVVLRVLSQNVTWQKQTFQMLIEIFHLNRKNIICLVSNGTICITMIGVYQWGALPRVKFLKDLVQVYIVLANITCQKAGFYTS